MIRCELEKISKVNIEWTRLRSYNGDQKNAFEELICQLARAEEIEGKRKFVRVAAPDAGVEAYCILDNGEEFGWQAKFFSSIGDSQWSQLTKSFETALSKHPRLTRYYICIPLDRADARLRGRKSLLDRWNEKVDDWTQIARRQGRKIEFVYWGDSEVFDRLSKTEHAGRRYYWFSQEEFSESWRKVFLISECVINLNLISNCRYRVLFKVCQGENIFIFNLKHLFVSSEESSTST